MGNSWLCSLLLIIGLSLGADAQLAAIFSNVSKSDDCHLWSSWGPCIWTEPLKPRGWSRRRVSLDENLYLTQLHPHCKSHWFYKFVKQRYGTILNSIFKYVKGVTKDRQPCGMCSYRQSCGYGGPKKCHQSPTERALLPLFVSEQLCPVYNQENACYMDYARLARNGGTCRVWPSPVPKLTGLSANIRAILYRQTWTNCVPSSDNRGRPVCRCCCWPYRPNPRTFRCQHI